MKRDYDAIHYIQRQLSGFEDKKMVFAMTKAFNKMYAAKEPDGCLSTTVELFIALKYLGYKPRICYGLVVPPSDYEFYHAWLELDGKIVDIAIYGNAKFSPSSAPGSSASSALVNCSGVLNSALAACTASATGSVLEKA